MDIVDCKNSDRSMYIPLAQKWRSATFDDLVGQDLSVKMLKNSLYRGTLFPVYLFAGQRGCGKTSMARIFAAALQCDRYTQFKDDPRTCMPCRTCAACTAVRQGTHPDVIEIDAASHTGVENIRQLIDAAMFFPVLGRWKVYVIDEAHMLSRAAFNALLKILEEPPRHVIFILATTDYSKIIDTVRSRCFQMFFDPIDQASIIRRLQHICTVEHIEIDIAALEAISQHCEGSLRDAITLLERVSFAYSSIKKHDVYATLGIASDDVIKELWQTMVAPQDSTSKTYVKDDNKLSVDGNIQVDESINSAQEHLLVGDSLSKNYSQRDTIIWLLDQAANKGIQPERLWKQCIEMPCVQGWLLSRHTNLYPWLSQDAQKLMQKVLVMLCEHEGLFMKTAHKYAFLKIIFCDIIDTVFGKTFPASLTVKEASQTNQRSSMVPERLLGEIKKNKKVVHSFDTARFDVKNDSGETACIGYVQKEKLNAGEPVNEYEKNEIKNGNDETSSATHIEARGRDRLGKRGGDSLKEWDDFLSQLQHKSNDISLLLFFKQALHVTVDHDKQMIALEFAAGGEFGRDYIIDKANVWTAIVHQCFGVAYTFAYSICPQEQSTQIVRREKAVVVDNSEEQNDQKKSERTLNNRIKKTSKKLESMPTAHLFHDVFGGELEA